MRYQIRKTNLRAGDDVCQGRYDVRIVRVRDKIVPTQLERRVYERLRDEIVGGELQPGEQLVEARLAAELGVSKTPVREALIRLQRDGLVAIEPYRGARVLEPSAGDVREILELRQVLECHIARELAERRPRAVLDALGASITRGQAGLAAGDEAQVIDALTEFSDVFDEASNNKRLANALAELRSVLLLIGNTSLRAAGREARSLKQHEKILAALEAGDADTAAAATAEHIQSIAEDSLAGLSGASTAPLRSASEAPARDGSRRSPRRATTPGRGKLPDRQ
jgi:DNA-binding GntR family transcriptional regulator